MKRRKLLVLAGGSLTTALAGCSGDDGESDDDQSDDTDTPAETEMEESTDEESMDTETEAETGTAEETSTPTPEETQTEQQTEADAEISLVMTEFDPAFVEIDPGSVVRWSSEEGSHTVTFYHGDNGTQQRVPDGVDALDEMLDSGASTTFTFSEPGVYDYYCRPHHAQGMVGSIVVGDNDSADQPGLSEPSGELPEGAQSALEDLNRRARIALGLQAPTVAEAVEAANSTIDELNNDSDGSLSTVNAGLENVDDVALIEEVQAGNTDEAAAAASRLRDEIDRLRDAVFTQVPKEINVQAQEEVGFDLVEQENITTAEEARSSADEIEGLGDAAAEAAEALRAVADIMEKIEAELTQAADLLENATEE